MAKQALGRDLGKLMGRDPKGNGALPAGKTEDAPLGAGVRSLIQKQGPAATSPRVPRWYLLAGDALLVALALITILKSPRPLSLGAEIFCVASIVLAAILGVIALLGTGAGVTPNGEAPKQFRNYKANTRHPDQ
ncbi:MAG TPA: hypothetical protein VH619_05465 [Verrucomicrobiae bacterium]|nr:hypothetical protein [Verrucomicrobiae bacterium]